MLKKSGQVSEFFEINNIFIEKRSIWLWEYGLFILWLDKNLLNKKIINKLLELSKKENVLFMQIEIIDYSNIETLGSFKSLINTRKEHRWFNKWYYKKFITPYTAIINLEKTEDEILSNMKPKWRYNIKLAIRKLVEVKIVEKNKKNTKDFYDLMLETTSRDNFSWNSLRYYEIFLKNLENSKLILAKKDWVVIAWAIFIFDKEVSIYYYWASSSKKEYRNLMAPYLIQWEAIKYAKSINSKIFDFLWVAKPNKKNDPLLWVTEFKKKFTKDIIKVSESYIFINKTILFYIIKFLKKLKK